VIVNGMVYGNMPAKEYFACKKIWSLKFKKHIKRRMQPMTFWLSKALVQRQQLI